MDEGNFSFITIRFHETDLEAFDNFYKYLFLPYIQGNLLYISGIEYPDTAERHCHAVIKNTTSKDNSKVLQKIQNLYNSKKNKMLNTLIQNAIDVKSVTRYNPKSEESKYTSKQCAIGYILKQSKTVISTNISEEMLDECRVAYYHEAKVPFCEVKHNLEYKNLSKGNMLLHMWNAHKDNPTVKIRDLPSLMVARLNYSFLSCQSSIRSAKLELKLKIEDTGSDFAYKKICLAESVDMGEMPELADANMYHAHSDQIKVLLSKIEILENKNGFLQDEVLSLKERLKNKN